MANIGELAEIVNATELTLEVGSNRYILLKDLDIHIGRIENRHPTTDGLVYTYGKGDNFFTAVLVVSTPEISTLNTLTQTDSNGDLTSTAWKIVANNVSGSSKTFAATGVLRDTDYKKVEEGVIEITIFVRITGDTVTVS
jgi:hypothetical protein